MLENDLLASSSDDSTIKIWNLETNLVVFTIKLPYECYDITILSNGRCVCSMTGTKGLALIDYHNGILIQTLPYEVDFKWEAYGLATLNKGEHFAGCMGEFLTTESIYLWSAFNDLKLEKTINDTNDTYVCQFDLTTLKDGNLATAGRDGRIRIFYTASGY